MYIYKRRNRYWVTYMVDGVRYQKSTHATTLKEARFFANAIDAARQAPSLEEAIEILRTIFRAKPRETMQLGDAWENYERMARAVGKLSIGAKSLKDRKNRVLAFERWVKENAATVKSVEDVTGKIAILYAQHLAAEGSKTKTRKNIITDLSTVWKMLEKSSSEIKNPWQNLTPQDTDGERGQPFTREEESAIMEAAKKIGKDWYEVCTVARHTGLRYGDVALLKWRDVTLVTTHSGKTPSGTPQESVLKLTPSKTQRHGVTVTIPLVKPVVDVLKSIPRRGDWIFPIHAELYNQFGGKDIMKFREVLDAAGIEGHTFHSWRHTFRTRLAEAGVDTETAMRLCGHTRAETSRRYDHDEHLAEMRAAIEAAQ